MSPSQRLHRPRLRCRLPRRLNLRLRRRPRPRNQQTSRRIRLLQRRRIRRLQRRRIRRLQRRRIRRPRPKRIHRPRRTRIRRPRRQSRLRRQTRRHRPIHQRMRSKGEQVRQNPHSPMKAVRLKSHRSIADYLRRNPRLDLPQHWNGRWFEIKPPPVFKFLPLLFFRSCVIIMASARPGCPPQPGRAAFNYHWILEFQLHFLALVLVKDFVCFENHVLQRGFVFWIELDHTEAQ